MPKGFSFKGAQPRRESTWIKPGLYLARIEKFKQGTTRKNRDHMTFEFMNCLTLDDSLGASTEGGSHRPGDKFSWMIMADWDTAEATVMAAVQKVTGLPVEELQDDDVYDQLTADSQPLAGIFVRVEARHIVTESGKPFTQVTIKSMISDSEAEEIIPDSTIESLGLEFAEGDDE